MFFCTPTAFYSFESQQGSSGVGQIVAGNNQPTDGDSTVDGELTKATFALNDAVCITEDSDGGFFLPEPRSHLLRRVNMRESKVETHQGKRNVKQHARPFLKPTCAIRDHSGKTIVVDSGLHRIVSINSKNLLTVLAGKERTPGFCDGRADTLLSRPHTAVSIPGVGIVFTDSGNNRIRRIALDHEVSTIAGNGVRGTVDGPALSSTFADPTSMIANAQGDLIVLEASTMRLRLLQNGIVSTILHPKIGFVSSLPGMTSLDVGPAGELYLGTTHGLWCYKPKLEIRQQWAETNSSAPRLSFRDSASSEALASSSITTTTQSTAISMATINEKSADTAEVSLRGTCVLPLPSIGRTYYLPLALVRLRCPSLLESRTISIMHKLHITQESWDLFLTYFLEDRLGPLDSDSQGWVNTVCLAVIAVVLKLKPLVEHCLWTNVLYCARPIDGASLASALHAAGKIISSISSMTELKGNALPEFEPIVEELMMAVVNHNQLFHTLEQLNLLKGALPTKYNDILKLKLKNQRPSQLFYMSRKRARLPQSLLGDLPSQLQQLWGHCISNSAGAGQDDADMKLEVSDNGASVLIPCHLFVLHARWPFINPIIKHGFKEIKDGKIQLMKPDGTLFEYSWAIQFLRYLYTGQLDMLSNDEFVTTTYQYADYLMLNLPQASGEAIHSHFMKLLQTTHAYRATSSS